MLVNENKPKQMLLLLIYTHCVDLKNQKHTHIVLRGGEERDPSEIQMSGGGETCYKCVLIYEYIQLCSPD